MQGLTKQVVGSYKAIEAKMEEGTSNRTVASTAMNATSSRAHTVVTIQFDQVIILYFLCGCVTRLTISNIDEHSDNYISQYFKGEYDYIK